MFHALVAALSIASLSVPYVPQTDALCGGAAAAMVFRYWGDTHADAGQFAAYIERRPGGVEGIADDVLEREVRARGWRVDRIDGSLDALRNRLAARQPVIVLLADRGSQYHYVVVVGATESAIVIHDPSWGPSRPVANDAFLRLWSASRYWSMVVLPGATGTKTAGTAPTTTDNEPRAADAENSPSKDRCDALLDRAIGEIRTAGLERAAEVLGAVRDQCPESAGPLRELAGVRFAEKRWNDAASLARDALVRQPGDEYALDVLGSSLFMVDDSTGALRAWNAIGKPRLDLVRIEGVTHARYQTITDALRLKPGALLTADDFLKARHRLDELPDRSSARLAVRPESDGFATVDVVIAERAGRPRGIAGWAGAAVRAGVDREAYVALPGFTGQGEVWTGSWRWWKNRPRVALGFAAPRVGGLFGVWRVEGSWEVETYADGATIRREGRKHGGVSVSDWMTGNLRYSMNAGADVWDGGRRAGSFGGSLERRWLNDRLSVSGDTTAWLPVDGGPAFAAGGVRAVVRSTSNARWSYETAAGTEHVSDAAPLALWPGAGEGRARTPLLRAHPLLDDGIIDVGERSSFGRAVQYATGEVQRWIPSPPLLRLGIAGFVDAARAGRQLHATSTGQVDVGMGLRVRVPGLNRVLRIDVAHGVRDGANALTVGWVY
jgi:predicted double-glycine peptidase